MEKEKLLEIRNNLSVLPVLEEHYERLRSRIYEAEADVRSLLGKYEAESLDVEQLKKDSLSKTLLILLGRYEGKLDKESREMLDAKMGYDKAFQRVKELCRERDELAGRITALRRDKDIYEAELKRREELITTGMVSEVSTQYKQLEAERQMLAKQLVETSEAIKAASRVKSTAKSAMQHLDKAEGWATYDVWAKGGIISHMAKYDHIDNAQADFNRLESQMNDLQKELSDVSFFNTLELSGIDSTTRAIDFWFDNIFTDLNVRNRIRGDIDQLRTLYGKIERIIDKLEGSMLKINKMLNDIEQRKNDLIISSQV